MPATNLQLAVMAKHYLIAAIWADAPEGTHPRASKATERFALEQCTRFVDLIGPLFEETIGRDGYGSHPDCGNVEPQCAAMGHDLYLTSSGHGVGFWDHNELKAGDLGDKLTAFCGHGTAFPDPEPTFYRGWLYF